MLYPWRKLFKAVCKPTLVSICTVVLTFYFKTDVDRLNQIQMLIKVKHPYN